jgi:hypothetical protein
MPESYSIKLVLGEPYHSRFWAKVDKTDSCWLWRGVPDSWGYGQFHVGGKRHGVMLKAHRLAWQMVHGKILDGLELDHLCRVPHCVNPDHLEPVPHRENLRRGIGNVPDKMRQTHCIYGHSLADAYRDSRGHRECRSCRPRRSQRRTAERRAARLLAKDST